jgi:hypothetical protein
MKKFSLTSAALAASLAAGICFGPAWSRTAARAEGAAADGPVYIAKCKVVEVSADGSERVLQSPTIKQRDGKEAAVLSGNEVAVSVGETENVALGESVRLRVHGLDDGRLRLLVTLGRSFAEDHFAEPIEPGDLVVHESSVRKVLTAKAGERVIVSLDEKLKLELTVTVAPKEAPGL